MKKLKTAAAELAENAASRLNESRVTMTGGKRLVIEGQRGVLEYGNERIAVASPEGRITVSGAALTLDAMDTDTLVISGRIAAVEREQL